MDLLQEAHDLICCEAEFTKDATEDRAGAPSATLAVDYDPNLGTQGMDDGRYGLSDFLDLCICVHWRATMRKVFEFDGARSE